MRHHPRSASPPATSRSRKFGLVAYGARLPTSGAPLDAGLVDAQIRRQRAICPPPRVQGAGAVLVMAGGLVGCAAGEPGIWSVPSAAARTAPYPPISPPAP